MTLTNFRAEDFERHESTDGKPPKDKPKPKPEPEPKTETVEAEVEVTEEPEVPAEVEAPVEEVPSGSVTELLEWVGDDLARASLALEAENARPTPRKTAVPALEAVIAEGK